MVAINGSEWYDLVANIATILVNLLLCTLQNCYTVCSESRCALRLRYVDLLVSTEVAVEVCCCFTVFSC
jgi:hypothetical protein